MMTTVKALLIKLAAAWGIYLLITRTGVLQSLAVSEPSWLQLLLTGVTMMLSAWWICNALVERRRLYSFTWYPRTIGYSVLYGALFAGICFVILHLLYRYSLDTPGLFELTFLPQVATLFSYLGGFLILASLFVITIAASWFLLNTEEDQTELVIPLVGVSYLFTYVNLYLVAGTDIAWFLHLLPNLLFVIAFGIAYGLFRRPGLFNALSYWRLAIMGTLLLAVIIHPLFYYVYTDQTEIALHRMAVTLQQEHAELVETRDPETRYPHMLYPETKHADTALPARPGRFMYAFYEQGQLAGRINPRSHVDLHIPTVEHPQPETRMLQSRGERYRYWQLMHPLNAGTHVSIYAPVPDWQHHLFVFVRFYLSVLLFTLLVMTIYQSLLLRQFTLFPTDERLLNRLVDSYLLIVIVFTMVLGMTMDYQIQRQHAQLLENDRLELLEHLAGELQAEAPQTYGTRLEKLPYQVVLYENRQARHYSPAASGLAAAVPTLPSGAFDQLAGQKRLTYTESLPVDGESRRALYHRFTAPISEQPADESPGGVPDDTTGGTSYILMSTVQPDQVPIPASLLGLSTNMITLYLLVFGLFVVIASLLARRLTRPLDELRSGLDHISSGSLDETIPVTTHDEIGELANTYNMMVYKLKDLQADLADAERQSAFSEMARQVAHEIKNPLTPMKLSIQQLQRQVASDQVDIEQLRPRIQEISNNLIEQIESLNHIASDFSRFARPITSEFEHHDLNEILQSIRELYRHDKQLQLHIDLSDEPLPIQCAPDELKRVFINLVKNAAEAIADGGMILIRSYRYRDRAYTEVVDNGSGIPEEAQSRIFAPNFSTKSSGSGLGLAICRKLVEAHDGEIQLASVKNVGTTFTLNFPLAPDS